jgi:non-homologous end joining protein Ku
VCDPAIEQFAPKNSSLLELMHFRSKVIDVAEFRGALENLIEEKIEHRDKAVPAPSKKKRRSNVVDLAFVLQESI